MAFFLGALLLLGMASPATTRMNQEADKTSLMSQARTTTSHTNFLWEGHYMRVNTTDSKLVVPEFDMTVSSQCEIVVKRKLQGEITWHGGSGALFPVGSCTLLKMETTGSLVLYGGNNNTEVIWTINPSISDRTKPCAYYLKLENDGVLHICQWDFRTTVSTAVWSSSDYCCSTIRHSGTPIP